MLVVIACLVGVLAAMVVVESGLMLLERAGLIADESSKVVL